MPVEDGRRRPQTGGTPQRPQTGSGAPAASPSRSGSKATVAVDLEGGEMHTSARVELMKLRKRVHLQACELQWKRSELELAQRELRQAQQAHDELRLKHNNLERIEQKTSGTLLAERRKNDELSRQVATMSQNLMGLCSSMETGGGQQQASGMQKQCFKLVQQNTALTVQYGLLRRQKGWAEAKARVLENEVASVYLRKTDRRLEEEPAPTPKALPVSEDDYNLKEDESEGTYRMLLSIAACRDKAVVQDFLTQLVRTQGREVQSFLQGPRITSEAVRNDCITTLSREFWALWRLDQMLPDALHAVERMVHLGEYLEAFEGIAAEIMSLLGCTGARMWIVDNFRGTMWTCFRGAGDVPVTQTCPLPRSQDPVDLAGKGLAAAACVTEGLVTVKDANADPRFYEAADGGGWGPTCSLLCVPIMRPGKNKAKVAIVLQAMNKLLEPHFDADFDGEVLRLVGRVAREVSEVCEAFGAHRRNAKRKEVLLKTMDEHLPCGDPGQLLHALEIGLQKLFLASTVALHVISRRGTSAESSASDSLSQPPPRRRGSIARASIAGERPSTAQTTAPRRLLRVMRDGLRGIVGHVARTQVQASYSVSQLEEESPYDGISDLPVPDGMLHTVPILEDGTCAAICQFVCPERNHWVAKQRTMLVDDGCYHADNPEHAGLLQLLLTFVRRHLCIFALNNASATADSLRDVCLEEPVADPEDNDDEMVYKEEDQEWWEDDS